jgi:hypothetical protein
VKAYASRAVDACGVGGNQRHVAGGGGAYGLFGLFAVGDDSGDENEDDDDVDDDDDDEQEGEDENVSPPLKSCGHRLSYFSSPKTAAKMASLARNSAAPNVPEISRLQSRL